jgi:P pilus assembly chaperone PapD
MKRLIGIIAVILILVASQVFAAGSCVVSSTEKVVIDSKTQRVYVTLTCTGDGTIAAYSFNPVTFGVRGWYLYNVTTNPGASAPTDNYDITLVSDSEDIAGGLLADRSTSATQTVAIAPTTLGYHMSDGIIAITFANETANPSTIVMTLRFSSN